MIHTIQKISNGELVAMLKDDEILQWTFMWNEASKQYPDKNKVICPCGHHNKFDFNMKFYPGEIKQFDCDKCGNWLMQYKPFGMKYRVLC